MSFIQDDPTLDDDDDDDDTQSVDFLSRKNGHHHQDDDESLNSSRSSLQHPPPPPSVFKGVIITRQSSNTSQPTNPLYTGVPSSVSNNNIRRSSAADILPFNQASSIQTNKNESNVQMRNSVRP